MVLFSSCSTPIPVKCTIHQHMEGDWDILPQFLDASLSVFFLLFVFFLLTAGNTNTNPRASTSTACQHHKRSAFLSFSFFSLGLRSACIMHLKLDPVNFEAAVLRRLSIKKSPRRELRLDHHPSPAPLGSPVD